MPIVPLYPAAINPSFSSKLTGPQNSPTSIGQPDQSSLRSAGFTRDYEVGYGKPPVQSRFKPGQSGNPKGRRKGAKCFNTIVREALLRPVAVRTSAGTKKITSAEALVMKAIESGTKGDLRAIEKLLGWYANAIPSEGPGQTPADSSELPSATDEAILAELRQIILEQGDDLQPTEPRS